MLSKATAGCRLQKKRSTVDPWSFLARVNRGLDPFINEGIWIISFGKDKIYRIIGEENPNPAASGDGAKPAPLSNPLGAKRQK
jgi:hypothetical protein